MLDEEIGDEEIKYLTRPDIIDPYWAVASDEMPFHDFNRELCKPGVRQEFIDGAVGIRVDDDFWLVALLPWSFSEMSIEQIVQELWPEIEEPEFNPDVYAGS